MLKRILFGSLMFSLAFSTYARCYRYPIYGEAMPPLSEWPAFDTSTGISKIWDGKINGGGLNMGGVNIASDLIQPVGSIISDGGHVPLTQYGEFGGFDPEQVLYVCSPDEEGLLYEGFVATDNYNFGNVVVDEGVPEQVRTTYMQRIGWRAKHIATGKYFTDKWQLRPLTELERDVYGRILVKAKNFSDVQLQYIKIPSPAQVSAGFLYTAPASYGPMGNFNPFGWVQLISHNTSATATPSNKLPRCQEGESISSCSPSSFENVYGTGVLSNAHAHLGGDGSVFTTTKACVFSQVTPSVVFDSISVSELETGESRIGKIEVIYECENGAIPGVNSGQNAIGFKVNNNARAVAEHFGFKTTGNGVTKLFSDAYFENDFAKGVAIELFEAGKTTAMNWLTTSSMKQQGNKDGWYRVDGVIQNSETDPVGIYRAEFDVKLSKFSPATPVSAGKVIAIAEVIISVQ